jgi:hypothetical protein
MMTNLRIAALFTLALGANATAREYHTRNNDETEVFAMVMGAEIAANHWGSSELICFSIDGLDPDKKLVKELQQRHLDVCSQSEWRRRLACNFAVYLEPKTLTSSGDGRIHVQSVDFSDVNTGEVHVVTALRQGEYLLKKLNGRWSITGYVPDKQALPQ